MLDKIKTLRKTVASKAGRRKQGDGQYIVGLDIGTEFVKALIGKIVDGNQIEIIGTGRTHQELSDMQAGAISDIAAVVNNCDQALNQAEQQAGLRDGCGGRVGQRAHRAVVSGVRRDGVADQRPAPHHEYAIDYGDRVLQ